MSVPFIPKHIYAIEGIDRLGKSTLIQGILNTLGFYQVIHFSKPQRLAAYENLPAPEGMQFSKDTVSLFHYQQQSFINSMRLASAAAHFIFDRWHLGEAVYAPLYRGYSGDYVFDLEKQLFTSLGSVRLILLTEDFKISQHFQDDGQSLGPTEARQKEQELFLSAFERSAIPDKRVICVTGQDGGFKPKEQVLREALR